MFNFCLFGSGGGWEEEGLLCVSSLRVSVALRFPFPLGFWQLTAGTPWSRCVSLKVFLFLVTGFRSELELIGGEPAHFRLRSLQLSVPMSHSLYRPKGSDKDRREPARGCLHFRCFRWWQLGNRLELGKGTLRPWGILREGCGTSAPAPCLADALSCSRGWAPLSRFARAGTAQPLSSSPHCSRGAW